MGKKLVIVESPAKAKTISRFLGPDYVVEASVGHIRDLPANRKGLPAEHRKKWWADYAVDVENDFEPFYEVSPGKEKYVDRLKASLKDAEELVLATDEDREGESISWHLVQVLKPRKTMPIKRIAFHEITREAIQEALRSPREIDGELVEAQEARRILDRLYGYTLSPVLWTKVAKELSAGRVQSPAVKLIVDRERRRRDFKVAIYWDLRVELGAHGQNFPATLRAVDGQRIASGKDFDEMTGEIAGGKVRVLTEEETGELAESARTAKPWTVIDVKTVPGRENPPPPFRTTTLQQEANRKFGFSADRTMRIAQDLYEGVDIGGERVGLITYMRTDSLNLAAAAVQQTRELIQERFGAEHVPAKPNRYASKVANAQEAHEAIRPTDLHRTPESIRGALSALSPDHAKLYDLIYRRMLACQMKPAEVLRTTAEIQVQADGRRLDFVATGKQLTFPGFHLAYIEDVDDPDAELEGRERVLPKMQGGDVVELIKLEPQRHETKPPARYTDASLIKALEELGIGRPSTYATILSVIVDRGYVRKKGRELIPTFTAMMTTDLLDAHFSEFTNLQFTANMDESLDAIANGKEDSRAYLKRFFLGGNGQIGLKEAVDERKRAIPFPVLPLGVDPESSHPVVIRLGRDGEPFIQLGDDGDKRYANVPEDAAPADITLERALELLATKPKEADSVGVHPVTGRRLLVKKRGGYYLEAERTPEELEAKVKPTWISLPPAVDPYTLSQDDLDALCLLPRTIGRHPETGDEIVFRIGKYGPYIQCGREIRNVDDWRRGLNMTPEEAAALVAMPKAVAARSQRAQAGPIQEFGELEGAAGPVRILAGRFGPYVTDGTTNATIPKSKDPSTLTAAEAMELLRAKAAAGPPAKRGRFARGKTRKK